VVSLLALFGQGFVVGLSGAMIPGPLLVFTIQQSLRRSPWTGAVIIVGHVVVESLLVLAVVFGLHVLVVDHPAVVRWMRGVGGLLLIGMGAMAARGAAEPVGRAEGAGAGKRRAIGGGVVLTLFNPGFPLWWFTIGVTFLLSAMGRGWAAVVAFMVGHWLSDFAWYTVVSFSASRGGRLIKGAAYVWVIRALCLVLAAFGGLFIYRALRGA